MMTEADNYPELDQNKDISEQEQTEASQTEDKQDSSVIEEQTPVSESEVILEEQNNEQEKSVSTSHEEISSEKAPDSQIESLQQEIDSLKKQLEIQKEQAKNAESQFMRLTADFDNFRRRTSREKEEFESQVKKKIINEILPAVDNFERARSQIKPANDGEMLIHKSYQGVYKTLVEGLKKVGVSAMRPENQPFDPNFHEAMLREPTNEYPEGTVIEQLVRGYMVDDQVLRYAMVKVAMPGENEPENTNSGSQISEDNQE